MSYILAEGGYSHLSELMISTHPDPSGNRAVAPPARIVCVFAKEIGAHLRRSPSFVTSTSMSRNGEGAGTSLMLSEAQRDLKFPIARTGQRILFVERIVLATLLSPGQPWNPE